MASSPQKVKIVGAGFAGLVTGYYLIQKGLEVEFFEKTQRSGGLIGSFETEYGLVETAANGILNSIELEEICKTLKIKLLKPQGNNKKRYIFRGKPKSFPIKFIELSSLMKFGFRFLFSKKNLHPTEGETVHEWGRRVLGEQVTENIIVPALQGIYGTETGGLDADLIFGPVLKNKKRKKPRIRGTVSFSGGMQEFISSLEGYLKSNGAVFHYNSNIDFVDADELTVVATNISRASELIRGVYPELSKKLSEVEVNSLVSCTVFYRPEVGQLRGFGCLFPPSYHFNSLGVLFNTDIFSNRGSFRSETYILPGNFVESSDESVLLSIRKDRERFQGLKSEPLFSKITRWPQALPRYDIKLARCGKDLESQDGSCFLVGNYINGIGLSKIIRRAQLVAERIHNLQTGDENG